MTQARQPMLPFTANEFRTIANALNLEAQRFDSYRTRKSVSAGTHLVWRERAEELRALAVRAVAQAELAATE